MLGELRGFEHRGKELWWWNENVQSKVRVKMIVLNGLGVKMLKLEENIRKLRTRPRRR